MYAGMQLSADIKKNNKTLSMLVNREAPPQIHNRILELEIFPNKEG